MRKFKMIYRFCQALVFSMGFCLTLLFPLAAGAADSNPSAYSGEYPVLGLTVGDIPPFFNLVGGYYLKDYGFKLNGFSSAGMESVQLDLSKKLTDTKSFSANLSLVGGYLNLGGAISTIISLGSVIKGLGFYYGGAGMDVNWGGLAAELDAVLLTNQVVPVFQLGYIQRFN